MFGNVRNADSSNSRVLNRELFNIFHNGSRRRLGAQREQPQITLHLAPVPIVRWSGRRFLQDAVNERYCAAQLAPATPRQKSQSGALVC
jgi:hypothetical protein